MRHGQTPFNVVYGETRRDPGIRDPALTPEGRAQVARAAERLHELDVRRVIASPYTRALETAAVVRSVLDLPLQVEPAVGERSVFTCDIGTPRAALSRRWPEIAFDHLDEDWWPPIEESEGALEARCRHFRQRLCDGGDWRGTLVVTHWGVIRALTGHRTQNADLMRFDPTAPHPGGGVVVPHPDP